MQLGNLQREFTINVAYLIGYAYARGYELTLGDAYRDPRVHGAFGVKESYGATHSVHKVRLAIDFNLFVDGKYITDGNHEAYLVIGEFWESLHDLARWGGKFEINDANHFSFEYQGYK
jgi:hypothetical protein